jgi:hypothetical protein
LAPLRGAILLRAARAKYLYQYRKVADFCDIAREATAREGIRELIRAEM